MTPKRIAVGCWRSTLFPSVYLQYEECLIATKNISLKNEQLFDGFDFDMKASSQKDVEEHVCDE